ncbi:hypothetical protein [Guptibacillus hwajinpoensis]|uniref:hypothetical protein n=1 Tax=Guptibacillus hwajinpoensis TaxID=208199 RepID=UPI003D0355BE
MDDFLKNLKEDMNETVLKDIDFDNKNKRNVKNAIHYKQKKTRINIQQKLGFLLSIGFTIIVMFGIGYLTLDKLGFMALDEAPPTNEASELKSDIKAGNEDSSFTPPAQEELYEDLSKEEVATRMLNTVDYFDTASGEFELHDVFYDDSESNNRVEYTVSLKEQVGESVKSTTFYDEEIMGVKSNTNKTFYDGQKVWRIDNNRGEYYVNEPEVNGKQQTINPSDVFQVELRKLYDSPGLFRKSPPDSSAHITLFPYEKVAYYLGEENLWDIEKQNEELLGHNTIVLTGEIPKSDTDRMKGNQFRFWVDKDTGILVQYEVYDQNGELTSYLHPDRLEINIPVSSKEFVPNLDNYSEMEPEKPLYENSREADIEVVDHADYFPEEVDVVLTRLEKELPFLYEFKHQELELYSASYEQYKDFKQAYLTYSYKKPENEDGSGTKLLYVRQYHKDAVVRSIGDFVTGEKEKLEEFELNGIHWVCYQLKNSPETHFIGKSDDYSYEVVTQSVSAEVTKRLLESFKKND